MHYDEYEAAYEMTVTPEILENNGDDVDFLLDAVFFVTAFTGGVATLFVINLLFWYTSVI